MCAGNDVEMVKIVSFHDFEGCSLSFTLESTEEVAAEEQYERLYRRCARTLCCR